MSDSPPTPPQAPGPALATPGPALATPGPARPLGLIRRWWWVVVGLAAVALIVIVLAPLASPDPDGLESVAGEQGWLGAAQDALFGILPGYSIPGLDGSAGTIVSGLIGVGIVFLAILGLGWLLRRRGASRG